MRPSNCITLFIFLSFPPMFLVFFLQTAPATAVYVRREYNATVTTQIQGWLIIGFNACLFPCHVLIVSWLVLDFLAPWEGTIFLFCVCTASEAVMPWFFTNPGKCSSSTNGKQIWDANKSTFFSLIKHFFFSVMIWNGVAFHYSSAGNCHFLFQPLLPASCSTVDQEVLGRQFAESEKQ